MQVLADSRNCCNNRSASHPKRFPAAQPAQSSSNIFRTSVVQPLQERDGWAALGTLWVNPPCIRVLKPQTKTLFQTLFQRIQSCQKTKSSFHWCAAAEAGGQPGQLTSTIDRDSAASGRAGHAWWDRARGGGGGSKAAPERRLPSLLMPKRALTVQQHQDEHSAAV